MAPRMPVLVGPVALVWPSLGAGQVFSFMDLECNGKSRYLVKPWRLWHPGLAGEQVSVDGVLSLG